MKYVVIPAIARRGCQTLLPASPLALLPDSVAAWLTYKAFEATRQTVSHSLRKQTTEGYGFPSTVRSHVLVATEYVQNTQWLHAHSPYYSIDSCSLVRAFPFEFSPLFSWPFFPYFLVFNPCVLSLFLASHSLAPSLNRLPAWPRFGVVILYNLVMSIFPVSVRLYSVNQKLEDKE